VKRVITRCLIMSTIGLVHAFLAHADTLGSSMGIFIYPSQNQSQEQQQTDDYECFNWAKSQTGYDPMNPPQAAASPQQQGPSGARLGGAARGAAGGAIIGEIADDDAGKGAAIGATVGAMRAGREDRKNRQEQAQQAEQAAVQEQASNAQQFKNAYGACIEARGYSAKY